MSKEPDRPSEFRRYRQFLTALYLATAGAGVLLLTASVVHELVFRRPVVPLPDSALSEERPDPRELLACNEMVLELLTSMGETTCELFAATTKPPPNQGDRGKVSSEWSAFSRKWRDRWDVVNARCRFSELADASMGVAYDRMAQVHSDLPTMRLKYQSLLVRFDEEQAAELVEMRRALDLSRAALLSSVEALSPDEESRRPQ